MLVKATRKGFYKKIREEGDMFNFPGDCPSWAVEVNKQGSMAGKASEMKATEAVKLISKMQDADEITEFIDGDERATVIKEANERITDLEE